MCYAGMLGKGPRGVNCVTPVLQGMHEIDKVGISPDAGCGMPGKTRTVVLAGKHQSALPSNSIQQFAMLLHSARVGKCGEYNSFPEFTMLAF